MLKKEEILNLVQTVVNEFENKTQIQEDTILFGRDGLLNSLALVRLVVDLEQYIDDKYSKQVFLTSDKVFSLKHSPFQSVTRLTEFVNEEINNA